MHEMTSWLNQLGPGGLVLVGTLGLLLASQGVVWVLDKLEKHRFGPVQLGTLVTPLCTGFPNLMIGLFGRDRLQGDLVLHLNIGNNLANTSLVTGLVIFAAGPLVVQAGKGSSKKARQWNRAQWQALAFLWLGAGLLFYLARDGYVSREDGLGLTAIYVVYQFICLRGRGKSTAKSRLGWPAAVTVLAMLAASAWLIQWSILQFGKAMETVGDLLPGAYLGLFLGLLTVIPESFLLLRLALQKGSLGFAGLLGDCLVSVPLVIGLSAMLAPFTTTPVNALTDQAMRPYAHLGITMLAFTLLMTAKSAVPRKLGLLFMGLYGLIWWHASR